MFLFYFHSDGWLLLRWLKSLYLSFYPCFWFCPDMRPGNSIIIAPVDLGNGQGLCNATFSLAKTCLAVWCVFRCAIAHLMLFWTLHRRNLVQSWLDYAWRSLHRKMFYSVHFGEAEMEIRFVMCCVWGSCGLGDRTSFLKGHCGLCYCNGPLLMWSQIPFFVLGFAAEEQNTSVNKYFVMWLGRRGTWKPQLTFCPEHEKLRFPLLKWWIIMLSCPTVTWDSSSWLSLEH